jgi:hypothetical protein
VGAPAVAEAAACWWASATAWLTTAHQALRVELQRASMTHCVGYNEGTKGMRWGNGWEGQSGV